MSSIWESLRRLVIESDDDDLDYKAKKRLVAAHAKMAQRGILPNTGDQDRRGALARVMQDPTVRTVPSSTAADWQDDLPGQTVARGAPDDAPEPLPKPDQPAPGTASGIGAGRIAAKNAEPTSVSLGASARQIEPGASAIKSRFGVSPDAFYGDAPVKVDPQTGKRFPLQGRPSKDQPKDTQLAMEPFAAQHAKAMARSSGPDSGPKGKGDRTYDAGPWQQAAGHLPKGGEVRQSGKGQNVGSSTAGGSKLTAASGVREPDFTGQRFAPAGHTAPTDTEWEEDPTLSARRVGGKGGKRMRYDMPATGQAGRMARPASPGQGPEKVGIKGQGWVSPDEFNASDLRSRLAAKLAMRGADAANQRLGRFKGGRDFGAPELKGQAVDKSASAQKADARAAAVASKPIPVNTRRDTERPEPKGTPSPVVPSSASPEAGTVDRSKMKQMLAQRIAAMAAKKAGEPR